MLWLLFPPIASSFETLSFEVGSIKTNGWQINNASVSLLDINKQTQQLSLSAKQLRLPAPLSHLGFIDIQCASFSWNDNQIFCDNGQAKLKSSLLNPSISDFSFLLTKHKSSFSLQQKDTLNGNITIDAHEMAGNWLVNIKAEAIKLAFLHRLLSITGVEMPLDEISSGTLSVAIELQGNKSGFYQASIKGTIDQLSLQGLQGKVASNLVSLKIDLIAKRSKDHWNWQTKNHIEQGEIYYEPIFIDVKDSAIQLKANGQLASNGAISIESAKLIHKGVFEINVSGLFKKTANYQLSDANIICRVQDLEKLSKTYLSAFFEQTAFEGISFKGILDADITIKNAEITKISSQLKQFHLLDNEKRLQVENAQADINWSHTSSQQLKASYLQWDSVKIKAIPVKAGSLKFRTNRYEIELLEPSSLSILGGVLNIDQFDWQKMPDKEPKVLFKGGIQNISLEQLTLALNWMPLSGKITGTIPGVEYKDKTLSLNGGLNIKVFDGEININKLTSSGMFTDFSRLTMDMEINNLDLDELTQKIKLGGIEGRVSGFIKNLYLENWQPVTFYAWLGTPEDDDSTHIISQKAVQNIASIGGSSAADVISKGILRFFDTFGYDKLGFGCYLHQGVCQLMGVGAAKQGYYLIKGGGLPRIDIIGYNPRVDWNVLLQRLSRITVSDELVVE